ncbi:cell division protein ZipA [Rheinheimera maricola]|uniref:Cell division protein ZipA n=1 Tax=Rheinheimera maricola TaxID=2793282 RepID=A0ABS7XAZ9_9GAMM|nr:cell division protein ZipA [Rheinheimera maricola]MBZ9611893.1 cell division protein ZipA [Rheinheimera maricola]
MADELRLVFIIIGALVLGALLLHGLWTVRKNAGQPKHRYYDEQANSPTTEKADGFDEYGIGSVRVVKSAAKTQAAAAVSPEPAKAAPVSRNDASSNTRGVSTAAVAEVQTELPFDEPQEPQLNFSALPDDETAARPGNADSTSHHGNIHADTNVEPHFDSSPDSVSAEEEAPAEVLILYVLLPEHKEMKGPDLLSSLLTLGFKYGDMDIFHRHLDSAGSGAVLFSLANMFNPGTFDLENIDKLATRGVSLFMTLPGPGEPLQNFNLMHNAAKKLAEEFGGQVLDGQRSVLTVQTVRHYVDKIREFQRQQLIHG